MMKKLSKLFVIALLLSAVMGCYSPPSQGGAGGESVDSLVVPECKVTAVPDSLGYDKFYTKYVDVNGLPLVSSWRVPDSAFVAAHRTLYAMTSMLRPEILEAMKKASPTLMEPIMSVEKPPQLLMSVLWFGIRLQMK